MNLVRKTQVSRSRIIWIVVVTFLYTVLASAQSDPLRGFDAYVAQAVKDWNVPGMAIAVVHNGKVVFSKGYGVRRVTADDAVDTHTLFANASTTKAFTAMAIAMLVDEGKVKLDEPVVTYVPSFKVKDPYVTAQITVRDLLTHRTGVMPINAWSFGVSEKDYLHNMRYAPQRTSLRSATEYNNDMYVVAGELIESVSGMPWHSFVLERILKPLGMTETRMYHTALMNGGNAVHPHADVDGTIKEIEFSKVVDNADAAGSMVSNVSDMSKWIAFLLDSARVDGKRLVSAEMFSEILTPQTIFRPSLYPAAEQANYHFFAYGFGWFLQDYKGYKLAMHTGSLPGFCAIVGLLPEKNVGLVVFENVDHAELRHALMYSVFDRYLGDTKKDWSADLLKLFDGFKVQAKEAKEKREAQRVSGTHPTLDLKAYAGTYKNEFYGDILIDMSEGHLVLRFPGDKTATFDLSHWHYDVFKATGRSVVHPEVMIQFEISPGGGVSELRVGAFGEWGDVIEARKVE